SRPLVEYGGYCTTIVFRTGDEVRGPLHTNDELAVCGEPMFGRGPADTIEVSAADPGYIDGKGSAFPGANPQFVGPLKTTANLLKPPPNNGELKTIAEKGGLVLRCTSSIVLSGTNMAIESFEFNGTKPIPANGVVYVASAEGTQCKEKAGKKWSE